MTSRVEVPIPAYEQSRGIQLAAGILDAASLNQLPRWLVLEPWEWWMVWATAMQGADLLAYTAAVAAGTLTQVPPVTELGGHLKIAKAAGGEEYYRAMRLVVRSCYRDARAAKRETPSPPWAQVPPTMPGGLPVAIYWVGGVLAAAVGGYFMYDRAQVHKTRRAVQITQVKALAEVMRQTGIAQVQAAAGQKIEVGPSISSASRWDWWQSAGVGAAVWGGVVGGGLTYGAIKQYGPRAYQRARRALPAARSNPKRRRRHAGARHPKMGQGSSQKTLNRNIEIMIRAGHTPAQASAIAYAMARRSYRRRHPRGSFPAHLKKRGSKTKRRATTRRKNAARRPVRRPKATPRRKNVTKKKAAKRTRVTSPKAAKKKVAKKMTTRKATTRRNPKKGKKARAKKKPPAKKAQFVAYARRQGFSKAQAEAKWKTYRKRKR